MIFAFQDLSLSILTKDQMEGVIMAIEEKLKEHNGQPSQSSNSDDEASSRLPSTSTTSFATVPYQNSVAQWIFKTADAWFFTPVFEALASMVKNAYFSVFPTTITLDVCLQAFFSPALLHGDDMYSCEKCKELTLGTKQCQLARLPELLCVQLKRFRYGGDYNSKINARVSFPVFGLDMRPFCSSALLLDDPEAVTEYDLVSFITHYGGNAERGHYVAYCRSELDGDWHEYDDIHVTKMNAQEVQDRQAYVLFFRRRNHKEAQDDRDDRGTMTDDPQEG